MEDNMKAEIDLYKNAIYIVNNGLLTELSPMEKGTDEVTWEKSSISNVLRIQQVQLKNL